MNWLSSACLLALGLFFTSSVVPKLRRPYVFAAALLGYGIPRSPLWLLVTAAIGSEMLTAALLLVPVWPRLAAAAALLLLTLYSVFIAHALRGGKRNIACGCFAFGGDRAVSGTLFVRNGAAVVMAFVPLLANASAGSWLEWLMAAIVAAFLLTVLVLADDLGGFYDAIKIGMER